MRVRRDVVFMLGVAGSGLCTIAGPIWQNCNYFVDVQSSAMVQSPFDFFVDSDGVTSNGLIPPKDFSFQISLFLPEGDGDAFANSALVYTNNENVLSISGSVAADVDPGDFMTGGSGDARSSLLIQFDLPNGGSYRVVDGSFSGTHAGSSATLSGVGRDDIFSFSSSGNQPDGESGSLTPGGYNLQISSSALSSYLFFNGLFADASFSLDIEVIPNSACVGDLNNDNQVDDADFVIFVAAYNLLDCADPSMPPGCAADLNSDAVVDDADFVIFVGAYNELVCP
ncbi:MAG: hypothetical protein ACREJD_16210 [Phycisphaerales bacterium]